MINKITILLIFFFVMLLGSKSFSAQIRIEAYGIDEYFNYDLGKERQFLTYSNEGAQFFVQRGTSGDATVQSFEFVSATGRWEEMLGKKCLGAYTSMLQKRFMWQGKCEISDKTLERVKNYKKSE